MKIWTSEHTFNHHWETVTKAAWRKYPNPMNPAVKGIDVLEREVVNGVLRTKRLISSQWNFPSWASRIIGIANTCYAQEYSEVNPLKKEMTLKSRNLTFCSILSVDEKLTYLSHPDNPDHTLLKQEAIVTVKGVPLSSYMEDVLTSTISSNAHLGRQAMEWVIGKINAEVHELTTSAVKSMDEITMSAKRSMGDITNAAKKSMDDLTHLAESATSSNFTFKK